MKLPYPIAEVITNASGLVLSLTPGTSEPDIELTVTGDSNSTSVTKTDTPLRDVPLEAVSKEK